MQQFLKSRIKAFGYAFTGLWLAIRTQKNIWIYIAATIIIVLLGSWLKISALSWAVLVLTITMVWSAEIINTAIETVVDLIISEYHTKAKAAKDLGAASVLVAAIASVIIGIIILGPPLWAFFFTPNH